MKYATLQREWDSISTQYGADKLLSIQWFGRLCDAYQAKRRCYHSLNHIEGMLGLANAHRGKISHRNSFYFATWFHDAVMGFLSNSEQLSANMCKKAMTELGFPEAEIHKACSLILATQCHQLSNDPDTQLFLDIDLASLGMSREHYMKYSLGCRREYLIIPNWVYAFLRKRVLEELLRREVIFQTKEFSNLEKMARINLENEVLTL